MSSFAFGTYKITDTNPLHIEALKEALRGGVKMIETSAAYMNGAALQAIAKVLDSIEEQYRDVAVVSRFVLSKDFTVQPQLQETLKQLNLLQLDCFLLEIPQELLTEEMLDTTYEQVYKIFVALEKEVQGGSIQSYGVSLDQNFNGCEVFLKLAQNAAHEVGASKHSLTTIELAINLLEQDGIECAKWAKAQGLRVVAKRALNAMQDGLMFRLAEYDEPIDYYTNLNELLEVSDNDQLRSLYNLIEQLDDNKHKYGWIGDYDIFAASQILPHIKKSLENLSGETLELLLVYIERFLESYRAMVAYECSKMTRSQLKEQLQGCEQKLQKCALEFLLSLEFVDYIVVGMRKPTYVSQILGFAQ
ncbi:MAG: aldo/keto reductase [Epsilonproteobacteria bacterium]|nr:aldo/keto reductase [Campylobacterota bacterium]